MFAAASRNFGEGTLGYGVGRSLKDLQINYYVYIYIYMYICIYVICMYTHTHIYIYISLSHFCLFIHYLFIFTDIELIPGQDPDPHTTLLRKHEVLLTYKLTSFAQHTQPAKAKKHTSVLTGLIRANCPGCRDAPGMACAWS